MSWKKLIILCRFFATIDFSCSLVEMYLLVLYYKVNVAPVFWTTEDIIRCFFCFEWCGKCSWITQSVFLWSVVLGDRVWNSSQHLNRRQESAQDQCKVFLWGFFPLKRQSAAQPDVYECVFVRRDWRRARPQLIVCSAAIPCQPVEASHVRPSSSG